MGSALTQREISQAVSEQTRLLYALQPKLGRPAKGEPDAD